MPDIPAVREPATDWSTAFAALPADAAPIDAWPRVAARLDAQRARRRRPLWLASAAALVLAIAWPWHLHHGTPAPTTSTPVATRVATQAPPLERLYAESAQLEALIAYARDERVASGSAAALSTRYDARIAQIDAALAEPGLAADRQRALWQARVGMLRGLAAFEANRRWLATQGERYDGALVRVD